MHVWNVLHAARWKYRTQKIAICAPSHNFVGLYLHKLRHISTIGKNLLYSNTSRTCPYNMVNFGPLTAEICWRVWNTPANFNGFRVLAALLHGTLVVGVSETAALNRGRYLYLAGWPSRWALAHILVIFVMMSCLLILVLYINSLQIDVILSGFLKYFTDESWVLISVCCTHLIWYVIWWCVICGYVLTGILC